MTTVEVVTMEVPAMYADHHVVEVRRVLLALPGVKDVYASSSFKTVEVSYDPASIDEGAIKACLSEAGYLGEIPVSVETSTAASQNGEKPFFRQTAIHETTRQAVSFGQVVISSGRALWPCPGMGAVPSNVIKKMEE